MANKIHVRLMKQGTEAWNAWRWKVRTVQPDLSEADLSGADLSGADLSGANLSRVNLSWADLSGANLSEAGLIGATLIGTTLNSANLRDCGIGWTILDYVDLRGVVGLETIIHHGPSVIGTDTLNRSTGTIPAPFLRKSGMSENFITFVSSPMTTSIEYPTCFISYCSQDQEFGKRLSLDLQDQGIRCQHTPEEPEVGGTFWQPITRTLWYVDEAYDNEVLSAEVPESIWMYDKLVVVLSEYSLQSGQVEREVLDALAKEKRYGKWFLFPVRLDERVLHLTPAPWWLSEMRRHHEIGDFVRWKHHYHYQAALDRLLRDVQRYRF
jgi:Pentapeptide repeats (8 copies)/TIR domain